MRIYIISDDGMTLCREAPSAINEAEIVVGSNEELHAAPLSGKRLLALWNAGRACDFLWHSVLAYVGSIFVGKWSKIA